MTNPWLAVGAVLAGTGVALGAFGAHGLRSLVSEQALAVFDTAVRYQMYHALAILGLALGVGRLPARALNQTAWAFVLGIVLFSGSLYALVLTGAGWFGAVTPIGGVLFLAGWIRLAWSALNRLEP